MHYSRRLCLYLSDALRSKYRCSGRLSRCFVRCGEKRHPAYGNGTVSWMLFSSSEAVYNVAKSTLHGQGSFGSNFVSGSLAIYADAVFHAGGQSTKT